MTEPLSSEREVNSRVKRSPDTIRLGWRAWKFTDAAYHRRWLARVMKKIVVDANGCWRWQGFKGHTGYAMTSYRGINVNAHRAMYCVHFGVTLKTEQYVLHRCDVRDCLNPDHLWIGSQHDNNTDCARKGRHYEGSRDYCERGHPLFGDNVRIREQYKKGGIKRTCKTCERIHAKKDAASGKALARQRRYRARLKAQRASA